MKNLKTIIGEFKYDNFKMDNPSDILKMEKIGFDGGFNFEDLILNHSYPFTSVGSTVILTSVLRSINNFLKKTLLPLKSENGLISAFKIIWK